MLPLGNDEGRHGPPPDWVPPCHRSVAPREHLLVRRQLHLLLHLPPCPTSFFIHILHRHQGISTSTANPIFVRVRGRHQRDSPQNSPPCSLNSRRWTHNHGRSLISPPPPPRSPSQRPPDRDQAGTLPAPLPRVTGEALPAPRPPHGSSSFASRASSSLAASPFDALSGRFPFDTLSDLPSLTKLSLCSNSLFGSLPASLLPGLCSVFLQYNSFSGPIPYALLTNLTSLQVFNAANNRFSRPIPSLFPPNLRYLDLSSNVLSGPIPSAFPSSLQLLDLGFNSITDTIQPSLGLLQNLLYLWLDWNLLEGTIPAVLANCSSLLQLGLLGNALRGILPAAVAAIPSLQVLSLSHKALSGPVPSSSFFNSSSRAFLLWVLQLAFNGFSELAPPPKNELSGSYPRASAVSGKPRCRSLG